MRTLFLKVIRVLERLIKETFSAFLAFQQALPIAAAAAVRVLIGTLMGANTTRFEVLAMFYPLLVIG